MTIRILWAIDKQFDVSVDRVTWLEAAGHLIQRGHQVLLVTGYKKSKTDFGLGACHRYVSAPAVRGLGSILFSLNMLRVITSYLRRFRPDVIIVDFLICIGVSPLIQLRRLLCPGVTWILDIRTIPVESYGIRAAMDRFLFRRALRTGGKHMHGILVISPFMKEVISKERCVHADRIGIWSSGVDTTLFDPERVPEETIRSLREKWGLTDRFVVMYHGVLTGARGIRETIEAMEMVKADHPDMVLVLIGQGNALPALKSLVRERAMESCVVFVDTIPHEQVPSYIALCHAGILPFPALMWWRVSSPIKLMEYMAMGKPVILSDIEAHRDVIKNRNQGIWIHDNRPETIAEALRKTRTLGPALHNMGRYGRKTAMRQYTWTKQIAQMDMAIQSLKR